MLERKPTRHVLALITGIALSSTGCGDVPPLDDSDAAGNADALPCHGRALDGALTWHGDNQERLQEFLETHGCKNPAFDGTRAPVALYDWDNTVIKNDVGDIMTFWMVSQGKVRQPPAGDWGRTSPFLTADAKAALSASCDALAAPEAPLPTNTAQGVACADEIVSVYYDAKTSAGSPAFSGWNYRRMEPSYAWAAQLLAGYTPAEAEAFAGAAIEAALAADVGATQVVGSRTQNAYLRVYPQIEDLIGAMRSHRFDVWIVTASPEPVVRAFAPRVGLPPNKVIGIRAVVDAGGRLTHDLQECGGVANDTMINYIEGKRCWVNRIIYGDETAGALQPRPAGERQVFGAGDSDTDIEFLKDADGLRLVLNRRRRELMCYAYHDEGGTWLTNPMFIAPTSCAADPFPCSTSACKNADGVGGPCLDSTGAVIPDQTDTVCD